MITKGRERMYNILICDDERDIVSALKIYLEAEGYNTVLAYNGNEAVNAVKEKCGAFGAYGYYDARMRRHYRYDQKYAKFQIYP